MDLCNVVYLKIKNTNENRFFNPLYVEKSISQILKEIESLCENEVQILRLEKKQCELYYASVDLEINENDKKNVTTYLQGINDVAEFKMKEGK